MAGVFSMRIVTFGILSNKFSGQDTFLFNMNKHMKNVTFDYVVVGNSCIHEKTILRGSTMGVKAAEAFALVREYRR